MGAWGAWKTQINRPITSWKPQSLEVNIWELLHTVGAWIASISILRIQWILEQYTQAKNHTISRRGAAIFWFILQNLIHEYVDVEKLYSIVNLLEYAFFKDLLYSWNLGHVLGNVFGTHISLLLNPLLHLTCQDSRIEISRKHCNAWGRD